MHDILYIINDYLNLKNLINLLITCKIYIKNYNNLIKYNINQQLGFDIIEFNKEYLNNVLFQLNRLNNSSLILINKCLNNIFININKNKYIDIRWLMFLFNCRYNLYIKHSQDLNKFDLIIEKYKKNLIFNNKFIKIKKKILKK